MPNEVYELITLAFRYVFAALAVLIVLRAWRMTIVDSRRAAALRRLSPQTGLSGELVVLNGVGRVKKGMRFPVIREGIIGASSASDIRLRHASVSRRHAHFMLTERGLRIICIGRSFIRCPDHALHREALLRDGAEFSIGEVKLMLVLTAANGAEDPFDL